MDDYTGIVELLAAVGGVAVTVAGCIWALIRFAGRMYRVLPAVDRLHDLFGESPIEELHALVADIRTSVGEFEIRQRIAERHLEIGIYVCTPDGKCTWANDFLCDAFGVDSTDMLGFGWIGAVAKSEQVRVHTAWKSAVAEGIPYRESYEVEPRDGKDRWRAMTQAWPVVRGGKTVCYVGYVKKVD